MGRATEMAVARADREPVNWPTLLQQTQFAIGVFRLNSRELWALILMALAVGAFAGVVAVDKATKLAKLLRRGGTTSTSHSQEAEQDSRRSASPRRLGLAYTAWLVLVSLTCVGVSTDPSRFAKFEVLIVLLTAIALFSDATTAPADTFWAKVRETLGASLLFDAVLSLRPYPFLWEGIFIASLGLFRAGLWWLKAKARVVSLDDVRSPFGRFLRAALLLGFAALFIAWLGPGLLSLLTGWSQSDAQDLGESLQLWALFFTPLALPLFLYRWMVPNVPAEMRREGPARTSIAGAPPVSASKSVGAPAGAADPSDAEQECTFLFSNSQKNGRTGDGAVEAMAFSPSGSILVTCSVEHVWKRGPDEGSVFSHYRSTMELWDVTTARTIGRAVGEPAQWRAVAFSPDGRSVATGCSTNGAVRIWNLDDLNALAGMAISYDPARDRGFARYPSATAGLRVGALAYSTDGRLIAAVHNDRMIELRDLTHDRIIGRVVRARRPRLEITLRPIRDIAFSVETFLLTATAGGRIRRWNMCTGRRIGRTCEGYSAAYSSAGDVLATGGRNDVGLGPARASGIGKPLSGHTQLVGALSFSPDSSMLGSGSNDQTIRLWDSATGRLIGGPFTRAHGDGGHARRDGEISCLAISTDNRTLAAADYSGAVWLRGLTLASRNVQADSRGS